MNCNRNFQKSALDTYTIQETAVATNAALPLELNYISTGSSISHTAGSTTINLLKSGLYLVTFSAVGAESTTAGEVTIQLYRNGVAVPGALATITSANTTDALNFSFTSLIQTKDVCPCASVGNPSIPLTFMNMGVAATFSNIKVTVTKLA